MNKMIFSILLIFLCGQIFAQNNQAEKKIETDSTDKLSNSYHHSESVLKLNIFSPLLGYAQFSFEKLIAASRSVEFGLGIIGAGKNLKIQPNIFSLGRDNFYRSGHKNQFGGFFEFGYKFMKPDKSYNLSGSNFSATQSFERAYIKPSLVFGAYSFNQFRDDSTTTTVRRHHRFGALMVNLGYQWKYYSRIVFEVYGGIGGEIDNVKDEDDLYGHPFVLVIAKDNPSVNLSFAAGFRIGFLLK